MKRLIQALVELVFYCIICYIVDIAVSAVNPSPRDLASVQLGFTVCAVMLLFAQRRGE
jgi:hypothetical protein